MPDTINDTIKDKKNYTIKSKSAPGQHAAATGQPVKNNRKTSAILTFGIMFAVWVLLSGKFDLFHMSLGLISCLLVAYFSGDLLLPSPDLVRMPGIWWRFIKYIPWLLYQVLVANIHVMYLAFHPRMMDLIDPQIMRFKSTLKSDMALVTLANSITLTPGTITIYVSSYGNISFHVIDIESGKTLPWIMEARVAEIFGE